MRRSPRCLSLALLWGMFLLPGCGDDWDLGIWQGALSAYCSVNVIGKGTKQVETDYLPHVIACENGSADTEALKAQAVAARSYLYYKIDSSGSASICDSQSCQVYTCSRSPSSAHYAAVKATAGQVVRWGGVTICAFYVAGAKPTSTSCVGAPGGASTEKYVTYNWNKSGSSVTQSSLGWVSPSNKYNRGCKSQNGAHCLSLQKWNYTNILKFYYGMDIQLTTATGSCVGPTPDSRPWPKPDTRPPPKPDSRPPRLDLRPARDTRPPDQQPGARDQRPWPPADGQEADSLRWTEAGPPISPGGSGATVLHGGCSTTASPAGHSWLLAVGILAFLVRKRRSQRKP